MSDSSLLAFQMAEVFDAAKYIVCGLILALGLGIWIHATYFRKDNDEVR